MATPAVNRNKGRESRSAAPAMLGAKIRRLRRDAGLTQAGLAERLAISASYLNLIENNHRPVTVGLLLKLGRIFQLDLQSLAEDESAQLVGGLTEMFADPLFASNAVPRDDLAELAGGHPETAKAILVMFRAWREACEALRLHDGDAGAMVKPGAVTAADAATEAVYDLFDRHGSFFPDLEAAADAFWQRVGGEAGPLARHLELRLGADHGIRVRVLPTEVMGPLHRRFDRHSRRLFVSEMLPVPSRTFQLAVELGHQSHRELIDRLIAEAGFSIEGAADLARIGLANYFAAALMMPYDRFYRAATAVRYDLDILACRFDASVEQVCHRLITLQRPGARGVPFFMIRIDRAGNVSKRFSALRQAFPRYGGACPRWNAHDAFASPGHVRRQVSQMPEGDRYFSIARMVTKPGSGFHRPGQTFAIALGCEIAEAAQLVYADGMDLENEEAAVPIGLHCRVCERTDCVQRAFPPANRRLTLDPAIRGATPYQFESG